MIDTCTNGRTGGQRSVWSVACFIGGRRKVPGVDKCRRRSWPPNYNIFRQLTGHTWFLRSLVIKPLARIQRWPFRVAIANSSLCAQEYRSQGAVYHSSSKITVANTFKPGNTSSFVHFQTPCLILGRLSPNIPELCSLIRLRCRLLSRSFRPAFRPWTTHSNPHVFLYNI